jgi:hypothetical protein
MKQIGDISDIKVTQNFDKMNQSRTCFINKHTKFVKKKKNQIKEDTQNSCVNMKFKFFGIKKLEIPKNDNLKIMLPEDLFNMTNGHDLCRASAHKPKFFGNLSINVIKTTNGQDLCEASCQYLPTYQPTKVLILIYFNFNFFAFSL